MSSVQIEAVDRHPVLISALCVILAGAVGLRLLGLPPADLHGPLHRLGIMDPLCGGTRAALALTHGELSRSWRFNPLVPVLALVSIGLVVRSAFGTVTNLWINVSAWPRSTRFVGAALVAVLWANQQAHAGLLMRP